MIILIIIVFALIVALQAPKLIREQKHKELTFFSILLFIGFVLNILMCLNVKIPSIKEGVRIVLNAIKLHY